MLSKADTSSPLSFTQDLSQHDSVLEDTFLECILPEYGLKVNYPATWTKLDANLPAPINIAFMSQKENPSDSFIEGLGFGVSDIPNNMSLKALLDGSLQHLKGVNSDFILHESIPTTVSGVPAQQLVFTSGVTPSGSII